MVAWELLDSFSIFIIIIIICQEWNAWEGFK